MDRFMSIAIREADEGIARRDGGPFGAVVVKDGVVIASGHNTVVADNDPTAHGEIVAIRRAAKKLGTFDLSGCDLYTTAAPCPMCLGAIRWANIRHVYYGCRVDDTDAIGFRDAVFYAEDGKDGVRPAMTECDRAACLDLFGRYRQRQDRIPY